MHKPHRYVKREEENAFYTDNRAFLAVKEAIGRNNSVLIVGEPGCGKTSLMHSVGHDLYHDDYIVIEISKFAEIEQDTDPESKKLYLWDNAFGIFNFDISFTDAMEHYQDIDLLLNDKYSKLIMTCRTSVYKKIEKFNFSFVVQKIDISDPSLSLNATQKRGLFRHVCSQNDIEVVNELVELVGCCDNQAFPLMCALYADFVELQGENAKSFFQNPIQTFLGFLDNLQEESPLTYMCLACVVLESRISYPLDESYFSEKLEMALKASKQQDKNSKDFIAEFSRIVRETCWLQKRDNVCTFKHTYIYEIVAYHYGKDHIDNILLRLGCNFIAEKVSVVNGTNAELYIHVENEKLSERLFADIQDMEYLDVFTNPCWKAESFCTVFKRVMKSNTDSNFFQLFFKEKPEKPYTLNYRIDVSKKFAKNYTFLKSNDFEWFRQKLLEERIEKVIGSRIHFEGRVKAISWVFGYGIDQLLPLSAMNEKCFKSLADSDHIRLLILAIFSKNEECLKIALNFVSPQNVNKTCLLETESVESESQFFNKHRKFTPLTAACYRGFSEAIKQLVEKGSDVNLKDENGNLSLVLLCRFGMTSDCKYLVEKGAMIHCSSGQGFTPLIAAVKNGNIDLVKFLITKSVDVNQCTADKKSPLHYAVKTGVLDLVELLTKNGSNVNATDRNRRSPLYVVSQNGFMEIARYLIYSNADINQCDIKQKSPLYCASKRGHLNIVKLLLNKGADVNISTKQNRTCLYRAAKRGHFAICESLIQKNANVDKTDKEGYSPLYWASKRGHIEIVKLLLENEASPNCKTDKKQTALHTAAKAGHIDIIRCLLESKCAVNSEDKRKRTALYCASKRGHTEVVKCLIEHGADINKTTKNMKSALFRAAKRNLTDVLQILIAAGANVNLANGNGESPLYFAAKRGHLDVVDHLLRANADVNSACKLNQTALYWASQGGYYSIAKRLVDNGADVHCKADRGKSALYCASKRGCLQIVTLLVNKGADVNIRNVKNQTPLFRACKRNYVKVSEYLIKQRADVNSRDTSEQTPLLWAAENGHFYIVQLLCDNGCDVNAFNRQRKTSLYCAAKNGHTEIVEYLLRRGADMEIKDKYDRSPKDMAERMGHTNIVEILRQFTNPLYLQQVTQ